MGPHELADQVGTPIGSPVGMLLSRGAQRRRWWFFMRIGWRSMLLEDAWKEVLTRISWPIGPLKTQLDVI